MTPILNEACDCNDGDHGEAALSCRYCMQWFSTSKEIKDHMISVHVVVHSVVQYAQGSSNMSNNGLIARDSMSGFVLVIAHLYL